MRAALMKMIRRLSVLILIAAAITCAFAWLIPAVLLFTNTAFLHDLLAMIGLQFIAATAAPVLYNMAELLELSDDSAPCTKPTRSAWVEQARD